MVQRKLFCFRFDYVDCGLWESLMWLASEQERVPAQIALVFRTLPYASLGSLSIRAIGCAFCNVIRNYTILPTLGRNWTLTDVPHHWPDRV